MTRLGFAATLPRVKPQRGWGRWTTGTRYALLLATAALASCTPEPRPLPQVPSGPTASVTTSTEALDWSYQGALGPEHWGRLRPEWAACSGAGQSPIDLPLEPLAGPPPEASPTVSLELPATSLTADSNGQLVALRGAGLALILDGQRSVIESIEVHTPAEHSLGGATFDAEFVFVAKSASGQPLLLSLLFRAGSANAAFAPLLEQLPALRAPGEHPLQAPVTLSGFAPESAPVLAYEGSLGAPPCTGGALRLVVAQVGELSSEQLAALRQAIPRSARPPVDRAGRPVTLYALSPPASSSTPAQAAQP